MKNKMNPPLPKKIPSPGRKLRVLLSQEGYYHFAPGGWREGLELDCRVGAAPMVL
jgi:hypothetical protein